MASISPWKGDTLRLRFRDADGIQRTVYLGKMPKKAAATLLGHVEKIIVANISRCAIEPATAAWIDDLKDVLRKKLSNVGLIKARDSHSLGPFIDQYIASRNDAKPATKTVWKRTQKHLLEYFDASQPLQIITKSDAKMFRQHLIGKGLADNTVRRTCGIAKQFLADAMDRELVSVNPFKQREIQTTTGSNQERMHYITKETAETVLLACPDAEWKLLFALSRYGGMRCPSEHLALRWCDVDWKRSRMTVRSPKTAHHEGGAQRVVPIFPELRPYLEECQKLASRDDEYVIKRRRSANINLRTQLLRILGRAKVKPWPKLFHNLRASCETDLAKIHPIKAVCDWIGNSIDMAARHYLQTTDEDFERAIQGEVTTKITTSPTASSSQGQPRKRKNTGNNHVSSVSGSSKVGDEGLDTFAASIILEKDLPPDTIDGNHRSNHFGNQSHTSSAWEELPESVRQTIVNLIGSAINQRPADR